jgi:hypothetical protein
MNQRGVLFMKHKKMMGVNYGMKKKFFYFVILGILLLVIAACVPTTSNMAPTQPSNPEPEDGASGVSITPTLSWTQSIDPNGDRVTYDLYLGIDKKNLEGNPLVKASNLDATSYMITEPLDYGTTYFWQVVAKDGKGGQISSPVWSFTTKVGSTNTPPSSPTNPNPENEASGVSLTPTLGWQASTDSDGDSVTYDLYFGEAEGTLSAKASNLDTNSYTFTESLDYETTYYWQVVAKDGRGGETEGTVWSFTTIKTTEEPNTPPTVPTNPDPEDGETGVSVTPTLGWQPSTDPDGDAVTYDLYFGEAEGTLSAKASNLNTNSYTITESLNYGTTYYWQVVAKDGRGGQTEGPVWSFKTMKDMGGAISDLDDLTADDSLYILKAFIDEDINGLISALDDYIDTNAPNLEESEDVFDTINMIKEYYQGLWEVYDANSDAIDKLQDMMLASESLIGNMDLRVQIVDQAKDDIITALGGTGEPETLVVDYRDLLNMRMQVWGFLSLYEVKEPLQPYFDAVDSIDPNYPLKYFLLEVSYGAISAFITTYEDSNEPWETEDFWDDLNSLVTTLVGINSDLEVLSTHDIFKEDVLYIDGLDFAIEKGKFILEHFNDLYYFEEDKTDELGWTDDNAISLYEYPYFAYVVGDINIKQTEVMGEPIDLISELFSEELSGLIDIVKELTFGNIDLLQETSLIALSEELNSALPDGLLELTTIIQTPVIIEESVEATVSIDLSIDLDFGALSDGTPLDLMSNNLGMNPAMIDELIEQEIWNILASDNMTQNQASTIYDIILSNLTFYDSTTNTLTIAIDDSIIAEVAIDVEWE